MTGGGAPPAAPRSRRRWRAALWTLAATAPFLLVFLAPSRPSAPTILLSDDDREALEDGLRLTGPRLSGRTAQGEAYALAADWAEPDGPQPQLVRIGPLEGRFEAADGAPLRLNAGGGEFLTQSRELTLTRGVRVESEEGYWMETEAALLDGRTQALRSLAPVRGEGPAGAISAESLEALDGDARNVLFKGRVRMTVLPAAARGSSAPARSSEEISDD
ncbi:LPS export ABC transporter periplasmic protein LptC [Neomegalonema sp.]|uniref:LPS export ABC transporter periplasmic protein LptC n=1 Tax=Neomegalonema sp. TaxID=2039713 RepID=UPI00262751BD|nr:LPS export ABC transporter periplasmic protein LptC [Neomegalonema sp.]MDD2869456.1 hypothetical protein [Neomegalonema sp.]